MATIDSKQVVDDIIAGKYLEDDCRKIVKYTNAWGNETYGCIFGNDPLDMYAASEYIINPTVY